MTRIWPFPWGSPAACLRLAAVCLLPLLLATCGEDGPSGPSGSPVIGRVEFTAGPLLSGGFFGPNLPVDRVHVVIVRPPSTIVKDTARAFDPDQAQLRLDLPILLRAAAESLDVTLELLSGTTVLFSGTSRLEARAGPPSGSPPPAIPLIYSGPGSQIAQLIIEPADSTLGQGDSLVMRVTGLDNAQQPIPAFYVGWSSSDTTIARVNGAGVVRGRVPRGTVYIRAKTPDTQAFPTGIVESTTVTLVPAPATLIKVAGDNQSAPVSSALPLMLEVEVRAGDNLPIAGVPVSFAANAPGASVDSATATTDANGVARTGATLGAGLGTQTFTATAGPAAPVTFTATATVVPTPTWTGAISTDWNVAGNWSPVGVPGSGDSVTIPGGTPNLPALTSNAAVAALLNNSTLNAGAFALSIAGNLRGSGSILGSSNVVMVAPATVVDQVAVPNLVVQGTSVTLGRNITVGGDLSVMSTGGNLSLGGRTATLTRDLLVVLGGTLTMTNAVDTLRVGRDAFFNGGSTSGILSTGVMFVGRHFTQANATSAQSFAPTGNHVVVFNGTGTQNIQFTNPGAGQSNFETLVLANPAGGVTVTSNVFLAGPVGFAPGVPRIAHGTGQTLFVAELLAANATLDNILVVANNVLITQFDSVSFINYSPSATPLTINHPGSATPFVFNDLSFGVTPVSGFYVSVNDIAADANVLTINMVNPTPGTGAPFIQTSGGAVVVWPAVAPGPRDWTGAVSTDWSDPANWNPAAVPTASDDVTITPAANQPTLTGPAFANSVVISGAGAQLTIGGQTLTTGNFTVHTDGLLVMTNPADVVIVNGDAAFQGGDETGRLTAGELRLAGSFNQAGQTSNLSFAASGSHRTVMIGASLQSVTFCCVVPVSGFQNLDLSGSAGINIQFAGNGVRVFDTLISQVGAGPAPTLYMLGQTLTAARFRIDKLIVDRGTLTLNEGGVPATQQLDNVTFQNYLTTQTQLAIVANGGSPRTLTFTNLTFQLLSAGNTGRYLNVTAPSGTLVVDLPGATPAGGNGPAFTSTTGAVTVNWPAAPGGTAVWTGAVSSDWFTPGNWSPAVVPTALHDVDFTQSFTNAPTINASTAIRDLAMTSGRTITVQGGAVLTINGDAVLGGTIAGPGSVTMAGSNKLVSGVFPNLDLAGIYALGGTLQVNGMLRVLGDLTLGANTINLFGDLQVLSAGQLFSTTSSSLVIVTGNVLFDGASSAGLLTAGQLLVAGNFTQAATNSNTSFAPSGTHQTNLNRASGTQTITFASPGTSGFHNLIYSGTGLVTLASDVRVFNTFISLVPSLVTGAGHTLTTTGIIEAGTTFDHVLLEVNSTQAASALSINNTVFQNYPSTATQLRIVHPGHAVADTFSALTFSSTPTSGFYLSAQDQNPSDGVPLTIHVTNTSPASGGSFVQTQNGAVVVWPGGPQPVITWTGAVSTDWSNPANWSSNTVPTFSDSVEIPAGGNQPTLTAQSFAGALVLANGTLTVNGQTLAVSGNFYSTGSGLLVMTNPLDVVSIGGNARFDGGGQLGFMSAGNLILGGDLVQVATNSPDSYHPSGTHTTLFSGSATQTISFATPGLIPGSSHLQEVAWAGLADLVLTSDVYAHGTFTDASSTARTINSASGHLLTVGGWNSAIGVTTFDGARLLIDQATPSALIVNNLTFDNQIATAVQLEVRSPGSGGTETFTNLTFTTTPAGGGLYLRAVDNLADANVLTIDMVNPSPGTDGGFSQAQGGAVIVWPAAGGGGSAVWTGAQDDNWNDPANWQGGSVPAPTDDVLLPAGMPNYPALISTETVANMVVEPGATVDFVDGSLEVTGDLTGGGTMLNGGPNMSGSGVTLEMAGLGSLVVTGFVTLGSDLLIAGDLNITGIPAHFDVNGFDLTVSNDMVLSTSGTMQMTNAAGSVSVGGTAVFDGGPLNGLMTAGTLFVQGNFVQSNGSSTNSFRANGLTTVFNGTAQQTITFSDSLLSFFDDLDLDNTSGILMASLVRVTGDLAVASGVNVTAVDGTVNGDGLDVLGDAFVSGNLAMGRLYMVGSLSMTGTWNTASVIFQGTGQTAPILPYNAVFVQVGSVTFASGPVSMNTLTVSSGTLDLNGRTTVGAAGVFITGGTLRPNNNTLNILGALTLSGTGTLTMQNALDSVITGATGAAIFGGGSTVGLMTDGVLRVGGSFTQTSGTSTTSFAPSGNHKTVLGAGAVRVANFASPGTGGTGSHFANLDVTGASGGLTLANDIVVDGALISAPTGLTPQLTGGGNTVTVMSLSITTPLTTSLIFDNAPLIVNEQGTSRSQQFDKAQFTGFPTNATLLDMTLMGTAVTPRPLQFNNVSFQTTVTNLYARLVSSNSQFVTVTMNASNDPTGGPSRSNPPFGTTVNGARIVWQ